MFAESNLVIKPRDPSLMPDPPQDIYVRHLLSHRGYPLWIPEPSRRLPQDYLREGLRIGDVGVVVPENGSFDVLFNICLPPEHPLHRRGVPDNFSPISLDSEDIDVFPSAEDPGRVIASPSVRQVAPPTESHARVEYDFRLPLSEGALLVLPQGAEHHDLRIKLIFLQEALQHAVDWYDFAVRRLYRIISHDSLYLITGFYKARSWSLASFPSVPNVPGTGEFPVRFTAQQPRGNLGSNYTWRHERALDWRVGPPDDSSNGIPNQAVFISGFKIAINDELLVWKRITVKATDQDQPDVSNVVGRGSWLPNVWSYLARMGSTSEAGAQYNVPSGSGTGASLAHGSPSDTSYITDNHMTISHVPQMHKSLHPSDIINRWLFSKEPSAEIAVTHDTQWTSLLEMGELESKDLLQRDRLESVLSVYNDVVLQNGAVLLQMKAVGASSTVDTCRQTLPLSASVQDDENTSPDASMDSSPLTTARSGNQRTYLNNYLQGLYGQTRHLSWSYTQSGPAHDTRWLAVAYVNGIEYGRGTAHNRRTAMEIAAEATYRALTDYHN